MNPRPKKTAQLPLALGIALLPVFLLWRIVESAANVLFLAVATVGMVLMMGAAL